MISFRKARGAPLLLAAVLFSMLALGCAEQSTGKPTGTTAGTSSGTPTTTVQGSPQAPDPGSRAEPRIPAQADWVDYGVILEAGAEGEWDYYLWGGFAFSVIKKDGVFFLYYQGSSDYRTSYDESVLWRSIGVATSRDGLNFSKHEGSPVLTWFPHNNGEEGAVSSAVTFGEGGEIVLFYGANSQETPITVNADGRVAVSQDGLTFEDRGPVLKRKDRSIWGSGDELFPVAAIHDQGRWAVYYIPNGTKESGKLGVAYGDRRDALSKSEAVTDGRDTLSVWGSAGHIRLGEGEYLLVLNNVREKWTEVRRVSIDTPALVSAPLATYRFDEVQQAVLFLDEETGTWFMFYRTNENSYGVKLAPAGERPIPTPTP